MTEYEILIKDLESQKTQLEYERGLQIGENDLLDYIAELLKGDPADKDYQKQLIDNLVYKVFIDDDNIIPILTIGNGKEIQNVRLSEVKEVLEKLYGKSVQTQLPPARHSPDNRGCLFIKERTNVRGKRNNSKDKRIGSAHTLYSQ